MTRGVGPRALLTHAQTLLSRHHQMARPSFSDHHRRNAAANANVSADENDDGYENASDDPATNAMVVVDETEFLASYWKEMNITDEGERVFMEEIVRGVTRHHQTLEVVLMLFYETTGGRYLRNEYNLMAIIVYLATHRLAELTFPKFRAFVRCCDPTKMSRLIAFIFDSTHLESSTGILRIGWDRILDHDYVSETLVKPLVRFAGEARVLVEELLERSERGMVPRRSEKGVTEQVPFLLTVPNPRRLPLPKYSHSTLTKARPIPKSLATGTGEKEAIAKAHEENRRKQKETYEKASKNLFAVAKRTPKPTPTSSSSTEPPTTTSSSHTPIKPRPVPPPNNVSVKLTATSILREDALVRRKRLEETKAMQEIETTLRDASEFSAWREHIRAKEEEEQRLEAEKRRLQVHLLHELTHESRANKQKANQAIVKEVRESVEGLKSVAEAVRRCEDVENRRRWEEVREVQEAVEVAKERVVIENQRKVHDVMVESQALKEKAQREANEELARKAELIRHIRLLERAIPPVGGIVKNPDLTQTSGVGLLGEMSIVELQERLVLVKKKHSEWEEQKRQEILNFKNLRSRQLAQKVDEIARERDSRRTRREEEALKSFRSAHTTAATSLRSTPGVSGRSSVISNVTTTTVGGLVTRLGEINDPTLKALQEKVAAKRAARLATKAAAKSASLKIGVKNAAGASSAEKILKSSVREMEDRWAELEEDDDEIKLLRKAEMLRLVSDDTAVAAV